MITLWNLQLAVNIDDELARQFSVVYIAKGCVNPHIDAYVLWKMGHSCLLKYLITIIIYCVISKAIGKPSQKRKNINIQDYIFKILTSGEGCSGDSLRLNHKIFLEWNGVLDLVGHLGFFAYDDDNLHFESCLSEHLCLDLAIRETKAIFIGVLHSQNDYICA